MGTRDVRIDTRLNKFIWHQVGCRCCCSPPAKREREREREIAILERGCTHSYPFMLTHPSLSTRVSATSRCASASSSLVNATTTRRPARRCTRWSRTLRSTASRVSRPRPSRRMPSNLLLNFCNTPQCLLYMHLPTSPYGACLRTLGSVARLR